MSKKLKQSEKKTKAEKAYQNLLDQISEIIRQAREQGIEFPFRVETFTCRSCGSYENFIENDQRIVCLKDSTRVNDELKFIIINEKERGYRLKRGATRYRTTYTYICPICGAYQEEVFVSEFED